MPVIRVRLARTTFVNRSVPPLSLPVSGEPPSLLTSWTFVASASAPTLRTRVACTASFHYVGIRPRLLELPVFFPLINHHVRPPSTRSLLLNDSRASITLLRCRLLPVPLRRQPPVLRAAAPPVVAVLSPVVGAVATSVRAAREPLPTKMTMTTAICCPPLSLPFRYAPSLVSFVSRDPLTLCSRFAHALQERKRKKVSGKTLAGSL